MPGLKNRADRQSRMNNNNFSFCSALLAARTNSVGLYPGSPSSLSTSQQCEGAKFWVLASSSFPPKPARLQQLALELAADFLHGGRVVRAFGGGAEAAAAKPKWRTDANCHDDDVFFRHGSGRSNGAGRRSVPCRFASIPTLSAFRPSFPQPPPPSPSHASLPRHFATGPGSPSQLTFKGHAHSSPNPLSLTLCLLSSAPRALVLSVLSVLIGQARAARAPRSSIYCQLMAWARRPR